MEKLQHKADKLQGKHPRMKSICLRIFVFFLGQLADERKKSQQIQKNINSASQ